PASWRPWYAQRINGQLGVAERDAAQKAAAHGDTPTVKQVDALGRAFVTVAHNRFARGGVLIEEPYATRVELDIENNQRAVADALGRVVMRYRQDVLSRPMHQASMEAGERWTLADVTGKPLRAWDSRGLVRRMTYDALRRPTGLYVLEGAAGGIERLAERIVYGEALGEASNHRARVYQAFDGAGVVTSAAYDFKGNLLAGTRQLLAEYKRAVDWQAAPALEGASFATAATYDALNRPITSTSPDGSVQRPVFNEANLLDQVQVQLRGAAALTPVVANLDYDAKGQRLKLVHGNGAVTTYTYDPLTFRLVRLRTTRPAAADPTASTLFLDATVVQDLRYTYDPAGNLTRIEDAALRTVFHDNQQVEPVCHYTYDAVYRLIEAQGREHVGQNAFSLAPAGGNHRDYPFAGHQVAAGDGQALRRYTQRYEYDAVGNFEVFRHLAGGSGWTRRYEYSEPSLLEPGKVSNRLSRTILGSSVDVFERYTHDAHGSMTSMPHLAAMDWDFKDQLARVDLGGGGTAYYAYDAAGQRVRKVIESVAGARQKERLYLGGFEIYRELGPGAATTLERESLHVMDDQQRVALVETLTVSGGAAVPLPSPQLRQQLGNHLGSASVELDASGALIAYEEYHPYGTTSFQAGRSAAEVSLKRYRYTGKERDEETGFSYHGARYYAPWMGRWTACDPSSLSDGVNLYAYVRNRPVKNVDRTGNKGEGAEVVGEKLSDGSEIASKHMHKNGADLQHLGLPPNRPGWVNVIKSNRHPRPEFWMTQKEKFHYTKEQEARNPAQKYSGDFGGAGSDFYGPNSSFRVLAVNLPKENGGHSGNNQSVWGSEVVIMFSLHSGQSYTLNMGHLTDVSESMIRASLTGEWLPPGTFIGKSRYELGTAKGAHVHIKNDRDIGENSKSGNLANGRGRRSEWLLALRRSNNPVTNVYVSPLRHPVQSTGFRG
ncbi:MAG TPA: RHS repeat-associated core domain-containing protein, partial [Kofleriaceae bacterium]|nr:RHS repeat-associated core domain-containing protein [Kofleriaceae bacterium]